MKENYIISFGLISGMFSMLLLFSFIKFFLRKTALIINDTYLTDMSKYEALGKINWNDVDKIQRIKKNSLQLTFKKPVIKEKKIFFIKKILLFMQNWNYKDSIIISSALLECDIDFLEHKILNSYNHYKNSKSSVS